MSDPNDIVFAAASFAARAHQHHFRKDDTTPYFSHPVRVCLVVRQVFGFDDPKMLAAALLHDTIEDTTTDHDDLVERFGSEVAGWASALSKDSRLPEEEREAAYCEVLRTADWPVKVLKLADLYDNIGDCSQLPTSGCEKLMKKGLRYLAAVRDGLPPQGEKALQLVEERLTKLQQRLTA